MRIQYYNNLLGKLRDAFMQCPKEDLRKIKLELTKEQCEDLFFLWKDEASKKWGMADCGCGQNLYCTKCGKKHLHLTWCKLSNDNKCDAKRGN